jgi:hypothetical protein
MTGEEFDALGPLNLRDMCLILTPSSVAGPNRPPPRSNELRKAHPSNGNELQDAMVATEERG